MNKELTKKLIAVITYGGIFENWSYSENDIGTIGTRPDIVSKHMNTSFKKGIQGLQNSGLIVKPIGFNDRGGIEVNVYQEITTLGKLDIE